MTAVPVGTLTDAELVLLGPRPTRVGPRPVMPAWAHLAPDRRAVAVRDARAGLVARRLLDPAAREGDDGLRRDLRSVLVLREAAATVVAVARCGPGGAHHGADHWYAHVVGDVVLLEQVSVDGVHRFALTAAADLPEILVAAVLHPGSGGTAAHGPPDLADQTDWWHAEIEVRGAVLRRQAWVSSPVGTWRQRPGRPRATARPVSPERARRAVARLAADVVSPAVEEATGDG